jgi:hypothetical protein
MSLAKRKELEDLKLANSKVEAEITTSYSQIRNAAVAQAKKDFQEFFTANQFVVKNMPPIFPSKESEGIKATYGSMYATLEKQKDSDHHFLIRSNIKGEDVEYNMGVYVNNPNYEEPKFNSFSVRAVPQKTELEQIEENITEARKSSENFQKLSEGLSETKARYSVSWRTLATHTKPSNESGPSFIAILTKIFD